MRSEGTSSQYDRLIPGQISGHIQYQHRYCETCQRYVPFKRHPRKKSTVCRGWRCSTCRRKQA